MASIDAVANSIVMPLWRFLCGASDSVTHLYMLRFLKKKSMFLDR